MPIGPSIRRMFGPMEHRVAELYRRIFIDLDNFAEIMHTWVPKAHRILEVGCGEGAFTERIVKTYPTASVTAIDISPHIGRLFRGNASNVNFHQESIESVANREPASFDLIVLADVLHHVPIDNRPSLLSAINQCLAPDGSLLLKDWTISTNLIHWLCEASDRYLTGDDVSYFTLSSIETILASPFGPDAILQTGTVRPWRNNLAILAKCTQFPRANIEDLESGRDSSESPFENSADSR